MNIQIRNLLRQLLLLSLLIPVCDVALAHDLPGSQFAGVWEHVGNFRKLNTDPVFTPEAAAFVENQLRLRARGDYTGDNSTRCIPPTMPTMITLGAQEIMVDEKKITWIMESINGIRWIWLDGRELPNLDEVRPVAFGHSTGHWEGDVLVVESIGFLGKSNMYVNFPNNESVFPSPQMRVTERMHTEENGNVMISERTIIDPVNFKEPWRTKVRYERRPDWELEEAICAENNRIEEYE